jgi:predicted nucleotidyltransferase
MKKVRLNIQETLKYQREMVIEIPDDMSESTLNGFLDRAQRKAQAAIDISYILEDFSDEINTVEQPDESTDSPWDTEIEIDDFDFID